MNSVFDVITCFSPHRESGGLLKRISRHTAPSSKGSSTSLSSLTVPVTVEDSPVLESSDDHQAKNYEVLLTVFVSLLRRDRLSLGKIFQRDVQSVVFTKLIELPLTYVQSEAQRLCESTEKLPHKLDTGKLAIYGLFAILKWFLKSRPTFLDFYKVCVDVSCPPTRSRLVGHRRGTSPPVH